MKYWVLLWPVFIFSLVYGQESNLLYMEFSLLRQNDNISFTKQPEAFYPGIKSISMDGSNLSLGGSYRGQYEYFRNENFQPSSAQNGWYLHRVLLHSHLKTKNGFELFVETGYSDVFGKLNESPVDVDHLYVNQAFLKYERQKLKVILGRENMRMGTGRLIDVREGPNVRRAFDGINVNYHFNKFELTSFYAIPVYPNAGIFDNQFLHSEEMVWGTSMTTARNKNNTLYHVYYLGVDYENNTYARGTDSETRHSLGLRINKSSGSFNFDNEAVYQFGQFGQDGISAWTISFNFWQIIAPFTVGIKTELISGDNGKGSLGTFNALYPRGAYFGRVAQFGPANLIDFHPYIQYRKRKLFIEIDYDHFWRFSTNDGVYDPALNIVFNGISNTRNIAGQIGTISSFELNRHLALEFETNYILVQDYIEDVVEEGKNLIHWVFTAQFQF